MFLQGSAVPQVSSLAAPPLPAAALSDSQATRDSRLSINTTLVHLSMSIAYILLKWQLLNYYMITGQILPPIKLNTHTDFPPEHQMSLASLLVVGCCLGLPHPTETAHRYSRWKTTNYLLGILCCGTFIMLATKFVVTLTYWDLKVLQHWILRLLSLGRHVQCSGEYVVWGNKGTDTGKSGKELRPWATQRYIATLRPGQAHRFSPRVVYARSVMGKVTAEQVFLWTLSFPMPAIVLPILHTHPPSRTDTVRPSETAVARQCHSTLNYGFSRQTYDALKYITHIDVCQL